MTRSDGPAGVPPLAFPRPEPPATGTRTEVRPGLDWVRQPLPFRLDHVNCWLLSGDDGLTLVDTCISSDTSRANWQAVLGDRVPDTLLVTHFHPDHAGLAGWFHERGAELLGGEVETRLSRRIWHADPAAYARLYEGWYRANGLAPDIVRGVAKQGNGYRSIVGEPPALDAWSWLDAGDDVRLGGRAWRTLVGRGHAPRMLMLHCADDNLLIAADQVLPTISPNVSLMPAPPVEPGDDVFESRDDDPLGSFLASLEALRPLPEDVLVLPSHGLPFTGLHARLDALAAHHAERLERVLDACVEPRSAAELFPVLFGRKLDAQQTSFALGEALAHARRLERAGELELVPGGDGVDRYARR